MTVDPQNPDSSVFLRCALPLHHIDSAVHRGAHGKPSQGLSLRDHMCGHGEGKRRSKAYSTIIAHRGGGRLA